MWSILEEHRHYLRDANRVAAFQSAIARTVRPTDIVLDLGAGTGILGLLACRAGARRVYAVEATNTLELARDLCRTNGFADRVTFVRGLSTAITLPEPADLVVSDQMGGFGYEGGVFEYFSDARVRHLKPGGRLIPAAVRLSVAPAEALEPYSRIEFWSGSPSAIECSPVRRLAVNLPQPSTIRASQLLGPPIDAPWVDPSRPSRVLRLQGSSRLTRQGTLHGLAGFFAARLTGEIGMTNSPLAADRIERPNVLLPIERPIDVAAGDSVKADVRVQPDDDMIAWTVEVSREGTPHRTFRHSMLHGLLLSRDDLARSDPRHVPTLTPRARADLTALSLCDGGHTVHDIEREVFARHRDLFATPERAARFVARVLAKQAG